MKKHFFVLLSTMMTSSLFSTSFCFGESIDVDNNQEALKLIQSNQLMNGVI